MIPNFFYGSGMYRKHPNHTYGRNWNNSANNRAQMLNIPKIYSAYKLKYEFKMNLAQLSYSWLLSQLLESPTIALLQIEKPPRLTTVTLFSKKNVPFKFNNF